MFGPLRGLPSWLRQHGPGDPIVVYQMGKVGSRSVYVSLRAQRMWRPLYHAHLLNDLDEIEDRVRASYPNPVQSLAEIERGRRLRGKIDRGRRRTWNVVSLVRDPVERNVSGFFENIIEYIPDIYERPRPISLPEVIDAFFERYDHIQPLVWFQSQLQPLFAIDVFSRVFDPSQGYSIYEADRARLLVMRLENLSACAEPAMEEFLGLRHFTLLTTNVATGRRYGELYAEFLRAVRMPESYLARMYDSKLARHFYTDAELDSFWRRWSDGPAEHD